VSIGGACSGQVLDHGPDEGPDKFVLDGIDSSVSVGGTVHDFLFLEDSQMLADHRLGLAQALPHIGNTGFLLVYHAQESQSQRVSQDFQFL